MSLIANKTHLLFGCAFFAWTWAGSATAYINGGDYKSTLKSYREWVAAHGWGVGTANPGRKEAKLNLPNVSVSRLVGEALAGVPRLDASEVPAEIKRAIADAAFEAVRKGLAENRELLVDGKAGDFHYLVGVVAYQAWWETNYGGKKEKHAHEKKLAALVAIGRQPLAKSKAEAK